MRNVRLAVECVLLFGGVPYLLLVLQRRGGIPFLTILLGIFAITLAIGMLDRPVRIAFLKGWRLTRKQVCHVLSRAVMAALLLLLLTLIMWPELLFMLPRTRPKIWILVMCFYPLVSVIPQEYMFRPFFMIRYRPLFGDGVFMLLSNALAFGWAHIFFMNPIAPLLSVPAGWLLAANWMKHRSLPSVWLEHALYGQIVFTTGLGWFFYNGAAHITNPLLP